MKEMSEQASAKVYDRLLTVVGVFQTVFEAARIVNADGTLCSVCSSTDGGTT